MAESKQFAVGDRVLIRLEGHWTPGMIVHVDEPTHYSVEAASMLWYVTADSLRPDDPFEDVLAMAEEADASDSLSSTWLGMQAEPTHFQMLHADVPAQDCWSQPMGTLYGLPVQITDNLPSSEADFSHLTQMGRELVWEKLRKRAMNADRKALKRTRKRQRQARKH